MTPNYVKTLLKPNGQKRHGRKVWSIDLETIWIPFFHATNVQQITAIPHDALGAPLRLAYDKNDGTVKFGNSGRPVIRVAKDLADSIRLVKDNFVAGLEQFASEVQGKQADEYNELVRLCSEAGKPIVERDKAAILAAIAEAMAQQEQEQTPVETVTEPPQAELVPA